MNSNPAVVQRRAVARRVLGQTVAMAVSAAMGALWVLTQTGADASVAGSRVTPPVWVSTPLIEAASAPPPIDPAPRELPPAVVGDEGVAPAAEPVTVALETIATPTVLPVDLGVLLQDLQADLVGLTGAETVAISVQVGDTMQSVAGGSLVRSASSAKAIWVAAAAILLGGETDAIEAEARLIARWSDNAAAGRVIDDVGIDRINSFVRGAGLRDTRLATWNEGVRSRASDLGTRGVVNVTTTNDLALFWSLLGNGELGDGTLSPTIADWFVDSPDDRSDDSPTGGVLPDRLPVDVAPLVAHKAGWLPPGCCDSDHTVLIAGGLVPDGNGRSYSIAVAVESIDSWQGALDGVGYAVCEIHEVLVGPDLDCVEPNDRFGRFSEAG